MVETVSVEMWLNQQLINSNPQARGLKDYCPNGLQVEGKNSISKIVFGVTASLEFLEKAIAAGADAVVVHHGIIWNFQDRAIRKDNILHKRLATVMNAGLNLFAYHLPLDIHPRVGNNITLAKALGLDTLSGYPVGANNGIYMCPVTDEQGDPGVPLIQILSRTQVAKFDSTKAPAGVVLAPGDDRDIKSIAICTGAAGIHFEEAINEGADLYITGEISEQHWHIAKETGVAYVAAGHHFTESFGVQALMEEMRPVFPDIELEFLNVYNPI